MNIAIISGNLTKDIEISSTKTGKHVTRFCLGVRRDKEATDFINDNGNLKITKKDRLKITNYGEKTKSIWLSFHFVYT